MCPTRHPIGKPDHAGAEHGSEIFGDESDGDGPRCEGQCSKPHHRCAKRSGTHSFSRYSDAGQTIDPSFSSTTPVERADSAGTSRNGFDSERVSHASSPTGYFPARTDAGSTTITERYLFDAACRAQVSQSSGSGKVDLV